MPEQNGEQNHNPTGVTINVNTPTLPGFENPKSKFITDKTNAPEKENQLPNGTDNEEALTKKQAAAMVCKELNKQQLLSVAAIIGPMFTYGAGIFSYGVALFFVAVGIIFGAFHAVRAKKELQRLKETYGV